MFNVTLILNFHGQIFKCYILAKRSHCHVTEKERYIERWASTVVINVDLSHDIDIELSRSTIQFGIFQDNDGIAMKRKTID